MNLLKFLLSFCFIILCSCADYKIKEAKPKKEKKFYSSYGFALIYDESLYNNDLLKKKLNNNKNETIHSFLRKNTFIKIVNPSNSMFVDVKINYKVDYPKIFNIVITEKIANDLGLDKNNPYVEIHEIKENKKFIAKESNTFDEERNVATKVPVDEIKMDVLSTSEILQQDNTINVKETNYSIIISDFYYIESAEKLKMQLAKSMQMDNFIVKKIGINIYRLSLGPFENFNTLKSAYISLNNLGFEDLNIYRK